MMMLGTVSAMRGTCSGSRTSDAPSPTASAPKNVALGRPKPRSCSASRISLPTSVRRATTSTVRSGLLNRMP